MDLSLEDGVIRLGLARLSFLQLDGEWKLDRTIPAHTIVSSCC